MSDLFEVRKDGPVTILSLKPTDDLIVTDLEDSTGILRVLYDARLAKQKVLLLEITEGRLSPSAVDRLWERGRASLEEQPRATKEENLPLLIRVRSMYEKAIAYNEKAVALGPSHAGAAALLGRTLLNVGRPEEALPHIQRAIRLAPYTPSNYLRYLGNAYHLLGRYEEAITAVERERARNPRGRLSHIWLAMNYAEAGRMEEARTAAKEVLKRDPKFSARRYAKTLDYKDPAANKRALAGLLKAGLPE